MNTFQKISDADLITITKTLVAEERMKTVQVIEHLQVIYDRRLHLKRGYQSLHEFLVKELGYSDGAAHRRISAMRLVSDVPEVKQSIAEGKLSLTTASQVQNFFQTEKKREKVYDRAEKLELLSSLAGTSRIQCERKLAEVSPAYVAKEQVLSIPQDDEVVRLMDEYRKLAMLSDGTSQNIIKSALKCAIAQLKAKEERNAALTSKRPEYVDKQIPVSSGRIAKTTGTPLEKLPSRFIPQVVKRVIWQRDKAQCAYIDPKTKRRCEARGHLEFDHAQPFAMAGKTTAENLRLMCKSHNQMLAMAAYGVKKMSKYAASQV